MKQPICCKQCIRWKKHKWKCWYVWEDKKICTKKACNKEEMEELDKYMLK